MQINCDFCTKIYKITEFKYKRAKHTHCCSDQCSRALRKKNSEKICKNCGKFFFGQQNTCSRKCTAAIKKIHKNCLYCKKEFILKKSLKDTKFCNASCYFKYKVQKESPLFNCAYCNKEFRRRKFIANRTNYKYCSKTCFGKHKTKLAKERYKDEDYWEYKLALQNWSLKIRERDNYTCQECGETIKKYLEAHHIKEKSLFPELTFDLNNGITLCLKCHIEKHRNNKGIVALMEQRIKQRYNAK